MKTKLGYDCTAFSMQRYGGVTKYLTELISGINQTEFSVKIKSLIYISKYLKEISGNFPLSGFYVDSDSRVVGRAIREINKLVAPLSYGRECFDIVHETYYRSKPVIAGKYRVLTVHDMIHELFPADFSDAVRHSQMKKESVTRADHIICVSETTKKDLIEVFNVDRDRITVVYHGYRVPDTAIVNRISRNKPYILYVGARRGYKNFDRFIEAYANSSFLKNNVEIIAFGGGAIKPIELAKIKGLAIQEKIHFLGGSDQQLAELYKSAACFIYPSVYEGFGFPPLEAMSYGCPVVCSNGGSIKEIVGDCALYFDPLNLDEITSALERVFLESASVDFLKTKYPEVLNKYSWDKCVRKTELVYRKIMNGG